uniref:Uncharacterized protein n=1 Tax=Pristionchus pacificus TaxID=54126 RepID=A0A8R1YWY0_PRIPA
MPDQLIGSLVSTIIHFNSCSITVSIWSILIASILFGILLSGNYFFFNKFREARMRTHSQDCLKARKLYIRREKSTQRNEGQRKKSITLSSKWTRTISNSPKSTRKVESEVLSIAGLSTQLDEIVSVMASGSPLQERNLEERIDRPMTEEEFMLSMKKVIEFITDNYRNPEKFPVSPETRPNDIFNQLPQKAPENPEKFDLVWNDFHEIIMRGCIQWQHPRFHAFFPCGRSYPDILAETLISSLGTVGITWAANPAITELDASMVNWLGRALGIPETFLFRGLDTCQSEGGGWLADTASDAIFCAIMAARHCKVEEELSKMSELEEDENMTASNRHTSKKHDRRAEIISKLVAYGSFEHHSSFEKACKMACVCCHPVEVYEDDDWGMRREVVEEAMEEDVKRGLIPFYLHIALGTTSTASSDHLAELTPMKEKYGVWIHVDAAYAGSAWVVEKYRNNAGIEHADSININLHKFFLTSASVTPFWTRHQKKYKDFFRVDPAYLKKKNGGNDLRNWGVQLTRRFKALKVYMLLRVYGINGMRAYVERMIGMTEYMESLLIKLPNIRKFGQTNYGLFCVQYHEEGMSEEQVNATTSHLCEFINNSHKMFFTHSNVRGHDIIRVAVTLERSTKKDVEKSVDLFSQLVDEFKKKKADDGNFLKTESSSSSIDSLVNEEYTVIDDPSHSVAV